MVVYTTIGHRGGRARARMKKAQVGGPASVEYELRPDGPTGHDRRREKKKERFPAGGFH